MKSGSSASSHSTGQSSEAVAISSWYHMSRSGFMCAGTLSPKRLYTICLICPARSRNPISTRPLRNVKTPRRGQAGGGGITCRPVLAHRVRASSAACFRRTGLFPRSTASAEMRILASESSNRLANASAEKPEKTTEWIAPVHARQRWE